MKDQKQQSMRERFREQFGDNVVWWQECLAEMRIGDPDFKRLLSFIETELAERDRDVVEWAEEKQKELKTKNFDGGNCNSTCHDSGAKTALTDLQEYIKNRK